MVRGVDARQRRDRGAAGEGAQLLQIRGDVGAAEDGARVRAQPRAQIGVGARPGAAEGDRAHRVAVAVDTARLPSKRTTTSDGGPDVAAATASAPPIIHAMPVAAGAGARGLPTAA